jgi:hypothetical protein
MRMGRVCSLQTMDKVSVREQSPLPLAVRYAHKEKMIAMGSVRCVWFSNCQSVCPRPATHDGAAAETFCLGGTTRCEQ